MALHDWLSLNPRHPTDEEEKDIISDIFVHTLLVKVMREPNGLCQDKN